jgi:hypothetical protein
VTLSAPVERAENNLSVTAKPLPGVSVNPASPTGGDSPHDNDKSEFTRELYASKARRLARTKKPRQAVRSGDVEADQQ